MIIKCMYICVGHIRVYVASASGANLEQIWALVWHLGPTLLDLVCCTACPTSLPSWHCHCAYCKERYREAFNFQIQNINFLYMNCIGMFLIFVCVRVCVCTLKSKQKCKTNLWRGWGVKHWDLFREKINMKKPKIPLAPFLCFSAQQDRLMF